MTPDAFTGAGRAAPAATPPGAQAFATAEGSPATRVTARISFDNGRRIASEAVILPGDGNEPFRVLSWRADIDLPATLGLRTGPQR
jgi:general secretion pathway protein K